MDGSEEDQSEEKLTTQCFKLQAKLAPVQIAPDPIAWLQMQQERSSRANLEVR
jgi:hypothetical protein